MTHLWARIKSEMAGSAVDFDEVDDWTTLSSSSEWRAYGQAVHAATTFMDRPPKLELVPTSSLKWLWYASEPLLELVPAKPPANMEAGWADISEHVNAIADALTGWNRRFSRLDGDSQASLRALIEREERWLELAWNADGRWVGCSNCDVSRAGR